VALGGGSEFAPLLDLVPHGSDTYVGAPRSYPFEGLYGGHVVAQALAAAALTVKQGYAPHSLHAYFLRMGDPSEPVRYEVERLRDGRSFLARQVVARQSSGAILNMSASFQTVAGPSRPNSSVPASPAHEPSPAATSSSPSAGAWSAVPPGPSSRATPDGWADVQLTAAPGVPGPEEGTDLAWGPLFDLRLVQGRFGHTGRWLPEDARRQSSADHWHVEGPSCSWARVRAALPEDRFTHAAALAYVSDTGPAWVVGALHEACCAPGQPWRPVSLDHALWFHRPFRADDWLLFCASASSISASRGLAWAQVFSREGCLVASVAQEVLLRRPPTSS
jgi:acyl-CoA thioesterase-2